MNKNNNNNNNKTKQNETATATATLNTLCLTKQKLDNNFPKNLYRPLCTRRVKPDSLLPKF